jgi:hypothetical protein
MALPRSFLRVGILFFSGFTAVALCLLWYPSGVAAAVSLRASATANNGAGATTITVNKPDGTVSGDVLVAGIHVRGNGSTAAVTAPPGWTLIRRTNLGNPTGAIGSVLSYYKVVDGGEPASYTWTFDASRRALGGMAAYSGVNNSTPIDVSGGQSNTSNSKAVTAPSITTTVTNTMVVGFFCLFDNATFTPPVGMMERWDFTVAKPSGLAFAATDQARSATGATGTRVATSSFSDTSIGQLIALRPAVGLPPTVSINSPANNATFTAPATISIDATASDTDGSVSKVEFFQNGTKLGEDITGPSYSYQWTNVPAGTYQLTAVATDNLGVTATSSAVNITVNNPIPAIASLSPQSVTAGGAGFTLMIDGANFVAGSIARWNGANRATTFVSPTRLTAAITAADIATAGTAVVTVFSPTPGGGTSSAVNLTVMNPVPTVATISPTSAGAGGAQFTLTVNGTNFVGTSVVRLNGDGLTTTFVSATQMTATVPASAITATGTLPVTVFNPTPGGGTSNALDLMVNNPPTVQQVLFVVGSTTLNGSDSALKSRLELLGYTVIVKDAVSALAADAGGKAAVVISETVLAGNVNTKFRDVAVPVVVSEAVVFDDMMMTGIVRGTDYDYLQSQTQVTIADASHPLAGGLTGTVTVMTAATSINWGAPGASAAKVSRAVDNPSLVTVFGYENGAAMVGMNAPARRVGFFLTGHDIAGLTSNGWTLFDAAINWAVNKAVNPPAGGSQAGQWSSLTSFGPRSAVHMHVLPNGKVLFHARGDLYDASIWDPATGTSTNTSLSPYNIYCSSHVFLANGELIMMGGHVASGVGLPDATTYNSSTNSWTK